MMERVLPLIATAIMLAIMLWIWLTECRMNNGDLPNKIIVTVFLALSIITLIQSRRKTMLAAKELSDSENRLNAMFNNMSSGVAIYRASQDGKSFFFAAFNKSGEHIEGLRREDIIGKDLQNIFPNVEELGFLAVLQRVWLTGESEHFDVVFYSDDHQISGWRENFVYKLPSGEIVAIYDDVTLRKQVEEELQKLNESLELRIKDEVKKNLEKERVLIHQGRHAAMGEMIGYIAHQWKQPLNSLALTVQETKVMFALGELDSNYIDKNVGDSMAIIKQMATTIDEFRNFFNPNQTLQSFELSSSVQDVLVLLKASLKDKNIELKLICEASVNYVGRRNELSQALLNIISNAKDALSEKNVENALIKIEISSDDKYAKISVIDNAGGIEPHIAQKIFEPYFTTKENGTGLGLYMTKLIVEQRLGGQIELNNEENGCEFVIKLPINTKPQDQQ